MNFKGIRTIFARDTKSFLFSPIFYVIAALSTAVWSAIFYKGLFDFVAQSFQLSQNGQGINIHEELFKNHFAIINFFTLFFAGAITMKLISEDRKNRTFDLLWTSPVTSLEIIIAKFFSGVSIVVLLILIGMVYPVSVSLFGRIDWGPLIASFLGLVLLSASYIAAGIFASVLTNSSILAVIASLILNFSLWLMAVGTEIADSALMIQIFDYLSFGQHLTQFLNGLIKTNSVVFFSSVCIFWIALANGALQFSMTSLDSQNIKKPTKIILAAVGVLLLGVGLARFILNAWLNIMSVGLIFVVLLLIVAVFTEFSTMKRFLSLRHTKKGLNLGASTILVLVLLIILNFIAFRKSVNWDLTPQGANTLSEQSKKVVASLTHDATLIFLYRNEENRAQGEAQILKLIELYKNESSKIKFESFNLLQHPEFQKEYNLQQNGVGVFLSYGDKKDRLYDLSEEGITNALIKVSSAQKKVIYFLIGHGEVSLEDGKVPEDVRTLSHTKLKLEELFYEVKSLNISQTKMIPVDASLLAIVGPSTPFSSFELETLTQWMDRGGRLLVALDPLTSQNLTPFLRLFGVEYTNSVIFHDVGRFIGSGPTLALGIANDFNHAVTRTMPPNTNAFFYNASSLRRLPTLKKDFKFSELIKTQTEAVARKDLSESSPVVDQGVLLIAAAVEGKGLLSSVSEEQKIVDDNKHFSLIVFGDSDFMTNQYLAQPPNFGLTINSFLFLSKDEKIMGIPPKSARASHIVISPEQAAYYIIFLAAFPLFFVVSGITVSMRRRAA